MSVIVAALDPIETVGFSDREISQIEYDSRKVLPGCLFFAFEGLHADGHEYIGKAAASGAIAIVHDKPIAQFIQGICYLRVADARLAMGPAARAFWNNPSDSLYVIGVTGTEGKSTTVSLIYQLLKLAGFRAGFFSTVMSDTGAGEVPNPEHQTTPEATSVQRMLASMRDAGCQFAVVEASSHGLSERTGRLADVTFDAGVMTNVTHEHLEFHGSWENYRSDKANLFRRLGRKSALKKVPGLPIPLPAFGVVNIEDPSAGYFRSLTGEKVYGFSGSGSPADFSASRIEADRSGASFTISGPAGFQSGARIELPGAFNVANTLAALAVVWGATGVKLEFLVRLLPHLKPVRGRMMEIRAGQPFEVIIDYAHTPSSFEAILPSIRQRVSGRIFCLFGSGGERDTEKRPQQGAIAARYCDVLVLADEDPRGEDSTRLLEDIAAGCPGLIRGERLFIIPDRPAAIRRTFSMAEPGDTVLLLGKGHENSIIKKTGAEPYDEEAEALSALSEMGYSADNLTRS